MKIFGRFWIFLLLCIGLIGCSLLPDELKTAERLIETAPDSALHILQHLSPDKYTSGENRALYGLLMIEALDKKHLPLKPDSLLDYSIDYYQQNQDNDRLATCYLYKGRTLKYALQYENAMQFYIKAEDEVENSKNKALIGRIFFDIGDVNSIQGEFKSAREKYDRAYSYFSKSNMKDLAFYALFCKGRTYHEAKQYKTARNYYGKIVRYASDSIQQGTLFQEMGLNFFDQKMNDSAMFYYRKVLNYPYIGNNKAIRYKLMADLHFSLQHVDSAYYYALNSFKYQPTIRTQRECYRILTNSEYLRGNMKSMSAYMNKYVQLGDSLRKIDAQTKGSYLETVHSVKKEANQNKHLAVYFGGLFLLVLLLSYLFYVILSRRNKKEKIQIQETHSEEKAGIRQNVIKDKRVVLQQKIESRKAALQKDQKSAPVAQREKQIRKIYEELLHVDEPEFFFSEMDIVLNKLITKLQKRYNGLTDKDLMWCCFHLLKIPTYDMLILLEYKNDNSLKRLKTRLSDKMELENATLLGDFLISILSED